MALHDRIENIIHNLRYREVSPHLRSCESIADLGCGRNHMFLKRFHGLAKKCWGLDITARDIDEGNIAIRNGDITQPLPFKDASLGQATCLAVLEHIEDPLSVLKESYRILEPGGRLILTTPSELGIHVHEVIRRLGLVQDVDEGEHKDFGMSLEKLVGWTRQAGFEIETAHAFELGMNLLVVARRPQ